MPVAGIGRGCAETVVAQTYEFLRAISAGNPTVSPNFADGCASALVCEAGRRAAELGRAVALRDVATMAGAPEGQPS